MTSRDELEARQDELLGWLAAPLTPTEGRVLAALVTGAKNLAIGRDLGMARATVECHVTALMHKLHARTRGEAVYTGLLLELVAIERRAGLAALRARLERGGT